MSKYVFVTGGVVSSLGKGIVTASLGSLLEACGLSVSLTKLDPYLNIDAGTMSPYQHGEVFVTEDGGEADLDLGHYERFTKTKCRRENNVTSGQVYRNVLEKERRGDYLGQTVQFVPHVTDEIIRSVHAGARGADVAIVEVGGTVGDIESLPFLEAVRQMYVQLGDGNVLSIHVTLLPVLAPTGELKTKPTQHSVMQIRSIGIQPDILVCRTPIELPPEDRAKISLFTNVAQEAVVPNLDVDTIYRVPLELHRYGLDDVVLRKLRLLPLRAELGAWNNFLEALDHPKDEVTIGIVGKYVRLPEAYKSLIEALTHAAAKTRTAVHVEFVDSEDVESQGVGPLGSLDGILVPGGFGSRGVSGMFMAAEFARLNRVPYLGICLGLHVAVIEFARNVLRWPGADSTEFNANTEHPVIAMVTEWQSIQGEQETRSSDQDMGGTMRLGAQETLLERDSLVYEAYGTESITERHRHRYEVNNDFLDDLCSGLRVTGWSGDKRLVEVIELEDHPWFLACQFHPELASTPSDGHPLFAAFVCSSLENKRSLADTSSDRNGDIVKSNVRRSGGGPL